MKLVLKLILKLDFETGFETGFETDRVVLVVERSKRKNGSKRFQENHNHNGREPS